MKFVNKIALSFVLFFSLASIVNTYLGEVERAQTNFIFLLMNGFAYIISASEEESENHVN